MRAHYKANTQRAKDRSKKWSAEHSEQRHATWNERYYGDPEKFRAKSAAWRQKNRERHRAYTRDFAKRNPQTVRAWQLSKYGLTPEAYDALLAMQNGGCAICGATIPSKRRKYFDVDHCHTHGHVRGLLCEICNRCVGMFRDSADRFAAAARYLTRSSHVARP